jgi:hypothetical protein
MEFERLKELKLAWPFQPFFLILKDGRRFLMQRSSNFGMAPDGSRVAALGPDGVVLLKLEDIADAQMVSGSPATS